MNNLIAAIDVGTNSIITIIAKKKQNRIQVIEEDYQIIRLGEGLSNTGSISQNAIDRCVIAFEKIKIKLNYYQISKIKCVATSAIRDAKNGMDVKNLIQKNFNIKIDVITGIEEAKLILNSTIHEFNLKLRNSLIFDIGGGSTELIFIENNKIQFCESIKIGAVRCTERFFKCDSVKNEEVERFEEYIIEELNILPFHKIDIAIGIAGTVTTLASVNMGLEEYKSELIHKSDLAFYEINQIKNQFQNLTLSQRKNIKGLDEKRAEVILAGTIICEQIMKKYKLEKIKVSDRGLRWGLLYGN